MTRDEQLDVLKGLLARVRSSARARGIEMPRESPRDVREQLPVTAEVDVPLALVDEPLLPATAHVPMTAHLLITSHSNGSGLTAFSETGTGTHAPLALTAAALVDPAASRVLAPAPAPAPALVDNDDDLDDDLPRTTVSVSFVADSPHASPQAPPLQPKPTRLPFEQAFEDEITSTANPAEIEALAMANAASEIAIPTPLPRDSSRPQARVLTPLPPVPVYVHAPPPPRPQRLSSLPAVPLSLDDLDLDGLGTPEAAISVPPPIAPSYAAPSYAPPARLTKPPTLVAPAPAALPNVPAPVPPTLPPAAPYVPTPVPPTPIYVSTLPPPRVVAHPVEAPPPALVESYSDPEEVELDDGDLITSSPPPAYRAPDPNATLRGSAAPPADMAMAGDLDDEAPASQRQVRLEDRPVDDQLEGIIEPPPESGEVESQRFAMVADEIDQTAEVHALSAVDVVERPRTNVGEPIATFTGSLPSGRRLTFGEILDSALDL